MTAFATASHPERHPWYHPRRHRFGRLPVSTYGRPVTLTGRNPIHKSCTSRSERLSYPPTHDYPRGKLRLLYEANPIAFIAEQAGGIATDGTDRILEVEPEEIHHRVPLVVGGRAEMEEFGRCAEVMEHLAASGG